MHKCSLNVAILLDLVLRLHVALYTSTGIPRRIPLQERLGQLFRVNPRMQVNNKLFTEQKFIDQ